MGKSADYRLQTLLEIKERAKDAADQAFADAQNALREQVEKLKAMQEELKKKIQFRERKHAEYAEAMMRGELSVTGSMSANSYIGRLKEEEAAFQNLIEEQKSVVAEHEAIVEEKRQEMILAHQDLKTLEKHKEKFLEQRKKERQAKEEDVMDEVAQTLFEHRKRNDE